jgi:hypothetical protein
MRMKMLKLYSSLREAVRCRTLTSSRAHALLRLEPQQQLTLAEEVKAKGLSVHEKRQRVRQMLGKELKWRLVPVRLSPETYQALQKIAPEGDIKRLSSKKPSKS